VVPNVRLDTEREPLRALPALQARIGRIEMRKVDRLSCFRIGSARYSAPNRHTGRKVEERAADGVILLGAVIADHALVAPGEASIDDDHYGGARPAPRRAVWPKPQAEKAFCALGQVANTFITAGCRGGGDQAGSEPAGTSWVQAQLSLLVRSEPPVDPGQFSTPPS
jgi:hypothetical protein